MVDDVSFSINEWYFVNRNQFPMALFPGDWVWTECWKMEDSCSSRSRNPRPLLLLHSSYKVRNLFFSSESFPPKRSDFTTVFRLRAWNLTNVFSRMSAYCSETFALFENSNGGLLCTIMILQFSYFPKKNEKWACWNHVMFGDKNLS